MKTWLHGTSGMRRPSFGFAVACAVLLTPSSPDAQFDLCGARACRTLAVRFGKRRDVSAGKNLRDNGSTITMSLPADGVLKFSSFRVTGRTFTIAGNAANT